MNYYAMSINSDANFGMKINYDPELKWGMEEQR